ncbi:MAG: peptidase, partial [Sphingobacteriales bacterium]
MTTGAHLRRQWMVSGYRLLATLVLTLLQMSFALGAEIGPLGQPSGSLNQQAWSIPSSVPGLVMTVEVFRPEGAGPFLLAVINHGSEESSLTRKDQRLPRFSELTELLLRAGYVVALPLRPGHGATGGPYLESQGPCGSPDYVGSGLGTARSIAATVDFFQQQSFVKSTGTLVVGNSAGGWGALAYASTQPKGLSGTINFAGGRGGRDKGRPNRNCAPQRLIEAAGLFGSTSKVPSLWLYAENDSYFAPDLSNKLAAAFEASGGAVQFHLLDAMTIDGHGLIQA